MLKSALITPPRWLRGYYRFAKAWRAYERLPGAERLSISETHPCVLDATPATPFDAHYFYQAVWAAKLIDSSRPPLHVDVGSDYRFAGSLAIHTPVAFLDIRPLNVGLERFSSVAGSILALPLADNSVASMSCLHVAEHIGLGRYGDTLNPLGTGQAACELRRALAPGGMLYFSLPVGRPRVQFNAHRIHAPSQILEYFSGLDLVQFAAVNDRGQFIDPADPADFASADYACGLFQFIKRRP